MSSFPKPRIVRLAIAALSPLSLGANPSPEPTALDQVTVTATRVEQDVFSVPYMVHVLDRADFIERRAVRTLPDALAETPGIMVQKTSYGQASPFLRGFTGFRTLLLVDGIRVNNAVFREGPNQYWSTLDPFIVDRLDIVMGPASVLHGSDAIGGAMNAITLTPAMSERPAAGGAGVHREAHYRYASAENSHVARLSVSSTPSGHFGVAAGLTWKTYDDLRGGKATGRQPATGYGERAADVKLHGKPVPHAAVTAAYQRFEQRGVPRTHATIAGIRFSGTSAGSDLLRDLDQRRELAYVQLALEPASAWLSRVRVSLSRHRQEEDQTRVRGNGRAETAGFRDDQYGVIVNLESEASFATLSYGVDYYYDRVGSHGTTTDGNGAVRALPRGNVADDGRHQLLGLYGQLQSRLGARVHVTAGIRSTHARARATTVDPDPADLAVFGPLDRANHALTGNVRVSFAAAPAWNVFAGVSQGFRAPNLSDFTSFELARSGERETPAPHLRPETFVGFELGTKARLAAVHTDLHAALFHTRIEDQITRFPTDRLIGTEREVTKANAGDGHISGVELAATTQLRAGFSWFGNLTWLTGRNELRNGTARNREPASRLQPFTVITGARWRAQHRPLWMEANARFARRQDDLSSGDVADTQRIPPGGTPGYRVFALRAGWQATRALTLTAALENIADADYRIHGSGVNEPGRNGVITARIVW